MNTCAIQISKRCNPVISKRGICSRCYEQLVNCEIIRKAESYPEWLQDMIMIQDAFDRYGARRSHEESFEELTKVE